MRDRFPLLLGSALLLGALATYWLVQGATRGAFADALSTYRSAPGGARALFLLAEEVGLPVERRQRDLLVLQERVQLVLLDVELLGATPVQDPSSPPKALLEDEEGEEAESPREARRGLYSPELDDEEVTALLEHVRRGGTALYAPDWAQKNELLDALDVALRAPFEDEGALHRLIPSQPMPHTAGVRELRAPVQAFLDVPERASPLLTDVDAGETVAALVPLGAGYVVVLGAPALARNEQLATADNARFWLSTLGTMSQRGPIHFDEFHHGFSADRSLADFGRAYGLHFAIAQLMVGLFFWAMSLRRFGPPRPPPEDERLGATDALSAASRLYREGRHYRFCAALLLKGAARSLSSLAGAPAHASVEEVVAGLAGRGQPALAQRLAALERQAAAVNGEHDIQRLAAAAADLRQELPSHHARA